MKSFLPLKTLLLALFCFWSSQCLAQDFPWSRRDGGLKPSEEISALDTGPDGSVFATGSYHDSATVGGILLPHAGSGDIFISKTDYHGNQLWVQRFGGSGGDKGLDIFVDDNGYFFVTGYAKILSGNFFRCALCAQHVVVGAYDPNGAVEWIKLIEGDNSLVGTSITGDGNAIYVGGLIQSKAYFTPDTIQCSGPTEAFLSKFDLNGNVVWAKAIGGGGVDLTYDLTVDTQGRIWATGTFQNQLILGSDTLQAGNDTRAWLASFDTSGAVLSARTYSGSGNMEISQITSNSAGGLLLAGNLSGTADFDTTIISAGSGSSTFLARQDQSGKLLWVSNFTCDSLSVASGLDEFSDGSIRMGGFFGSQWMGGTDTLQSAGSLDAFWVQTDASGNFVEARRFGSGDEDRMLSLVEAPAKNMYVAGSFEGNLPLGNDTLQAAGGSQDGFLALHSVPQELKLSQVSDTSFCPGDSLSLNYEVCGYFSPNNQFQLELSDNAGDFTAPVQIGSQAGSLSGNVTGVLPEPLPAGSNYRLRMQTTQPVQIGDTLGTFLQVAAVPEPDLGGDTLLCQGQSLLLDPGGSNASFLWSDGSTGSNLSVSTSGTYWVEVTNAAGCTSSDSITVTIDICIGREDFASQFQLQLFPNPARNQVKLQWNPVSYPLELSILDLTGRIAFRQILAPGQHELQLSLNASKLKPGFWLVKLSGNGKEQVLRLSRLP